MSQPNKGIQDHWTEAEETIIREVVSFLSYSQIATVLNAVFKTKRTKNSVTGKIDRMKRVRAA